MASASPPACSASSPSITAVLQSGGSDDSARAAASARSGRPPASAMRPSATRRKRSRSTGSSTRLAASRAREWACGVQASIAIRTAPTWPGARAMLVETIRSNEPHSQLLWAEATKPAATSAPPATATGSRPRRSATREASAPAASASPKSGVNTYRSLASDQVT